ncbi:MAG: hypothetical protein J7K53_09500 [Bacteroidales bacterium]|nr:hypothetical protein [Bacteroidales bacterium]
MVIGVNKFREYFIDFADSYIIIGGTACDIILEDAELVPRATKDIDMILIVEALKPEFVKQFWAFIKEANYERKEKCEDERKYYRFLKPEKKDFPKQIELFSRTPDLLDIDEESHLTPIPTGEDISRLSAILMNEDYYNYTLEHSMVKDNIHIANTEALICLKVKAFLDLTERLEKGEPVKKDDIPKHKKDVFRMAAMLTSEDVFELPDSIKADMQNFANVVENELPDKRMFKDLGLPQIDVSALFKQFLSNFKLEKE